MDKEIAQVVADYWKEVGIEIKDLRVIDGAVNSQMRAKQGAGYRDLMNSSSGPDYTCQGDLLLVQKDSGSNRMSWVDDKFEAMFKAFNQEFDQSKWRQDVQRGAGLRRRAGAGDLAVHRAHVLRRVQAPDL